ncbi:hypothetical protein [Parabacteroides sp.]
MSKRFFKPFVGKNYQTGINGKKTLVVGASFYCNKIKCKYFEECTDTSHKDSSKFDRVCPWYEGSGLLLSEEPSNNIDEYKTYKNFIRIIAKYTHLEDFYENWDCMAFTNYVQFFLPARNGYAPTQNYHLSERDFEAFNETLMELQPDIVIIWGTIVNRKVMLDNPYTIDTNEFPRTWYVSHIKMPRVKHNIALINPYHPSSSLWWTGLSDFERYLQQLLNE